MRSSAQGSGTAVGITGLEQVLRHCGHEVTRLSPGSEAGGNLLLRRLRFNLGLPRSNAWRDFDLLVGFDIDGVFLPRRNRRPPLVCSIKGVAAEEALRETGTARWMLGGLARVECVNARRADLVVTTSRYCCSAVRRHYGVTASKIRLVPEGIDLPRWQALCRDVPRDSDGATILCVARQYRRKRVVDLLRALTLVRRHVPKAHAVVVGDGPEHPRLRRLVRELGLSACVELTGAVPDDAEVALHYRRADVFCLPTIQEGFGIVFLEAMAAGLPVVSTTATAIPEVVPAGKAGLLVPPRDVPALADALVLLLRDPERRGQLAACGASWVSRFDWPEVADAFLATVAPLLADRHPSS